MWYNSVLCASIQVIKDSPRILSEKEYRKIAKRSVLLSPESLKYITNLNFIDLVRTVRKDIA